MTERHKVQPFSVAIKEGLERLLKHEAKILGMLPNLRGRVMSIRSDTWVIKIHDSVQMAYDDARAVMDEPHKYPIDVFFRVLGETDDPSLHNILADAMPDSLMTRYGNVSVIDKKRLN